MRARGRPGWRFGMSWIVATVLVLAQGASRGARVEEKARIGERLSGLRIPFIGNEGQTDPAVAYYAPTLTGTVFVTRGGRIVYSLPGKRALDARPRGGRTGERQRGTGTGWSLTETAVGGTAHPGAGLRAPSRVSDFRGNDPSRWRSALPTFEAVSLGEVWPRICVELRARGKGVEKLFTVEPGGDPSRIRIRIDGARSLRVGGEGELVLGTGLGEIALTPPAAFQERQGQRHPVLASYEARGREYGFRLGGYDPSLPVLIDPLLQATYLGGSGSDGVNGNGHGIAIHPTTGEVYLAGATASTNFPGTAGGLQTANAGSDDAFVARLNPSLTALDQATYLGGGGFDAATTLAIHPTSGDVYVGGNTFSADFPGTAGGAQSVYHGDSDAFVARLNAGLTTLKQTTYLGGHVGETVLDMAIHPTSGDVYVAGQTSSPDFPGTSGGAQPAIRGESDAFAARLSAALTTLEQATYLGGAGNEASNALAIDPTSGEVYLAGGTTSTDFPGTAGGAQAANAGGAADDFVARLNETLTALDRATYLGGSGEESNPSLAIHPTTGDVYVAATTDSTDFPGTAGGAQAAYGGGVQDAFAARFNPALTILRQATYLGGSAFDGASGITIHPVTGDAYVAGVTASANFPETATGAQSVYGGGIEDAFAARLNAALTALRQSTFLGGSNADFGRTLAIHPTLGEVYVAGDTNSTDFPGRAGGAQAALGGSTDVFLARLTRDLQATATLSELSPAKVWVGLANSDDVGIRFDLAANVNRNGAQIGEGHLDSVKGGSSGFQNAILHSIPLALREGVRIGSGDTLSIQVFVRNACSGSAKNSGAARIWFNGAPVDTGPTRDAGSRFDAAIGGSNDNYFLRRDLLLSNAAGSARAFRGVSVGAKCGNLKSFGTWSITLP